MARAFSVSTPIPNDIQPPAGSYTSKSTQTAFKTGDQVFSHWIYGDIFILAITKGSQMPATQGDIKYLGIWVYKKSFCIIIIN